MQRCTIQMDCTGNEHAAGNEHGLARLPCAVHSRLNGFCVDGLAVRHRTEISDI